MLTSCGDHQRDLAYRLCFNCPREVKNVGSGNQEGFQSIHISQTAVLNESVTRCSSSKGVKDYRTGQVDCLQTEKWQAIW
jgi:hypothetical protein